MKLFSALLIAILFFFMGVNYSQVQSNYGLDLSFRYISGYHYQRPQSALHLTSNGKIKLKKRFNLTFQIAIEDYTTNGYILTAFNRSNNIRLLYQPTQANSTYELFLVVNNNNQGERISLLKSNLKRSQWHDIAIAFDTNEDSVQLKIGDRILSKPLPQNLLAEDFDFYFGSYKDGDTWFNDRASVRLRNVKIFDAGNQVIHFWKLDEAHGTVAHDSESGLHAEVINPDWGINKFYRLSTKSQIKFKSDSSYYHGIAVTFDEKNNRMILITTNIIYYYDLNTQKYTSEKFTRPLKKINYLLEYDELKDRLYAAYWGGGKVSLYDSNKKSWSEVDSSQIHNGHYYYSRMLINPLNGDLLKIGGYGWYKAKNDLQKYDFSTNQWAKIDTKGDRLWPRLAPIIGKKNNNGDFFIMGGVGNESGEQKETLRQLNDLYLLSMKDSSFKKIADLKKESGIELDSYSLVYDEDSNELFFKGRLSDEKNSLYRIYKYDIKMKTMEAVSDTFRTFFSVWEPLYFDRTNKELVIVIIKHVGVDVFTAEISTLKYPPVSQMEYDAALAVSYDKGYLNNVFYGLIIITIAGISGTIFYQYNKKKKNKILPDNSEINGSLLQQAPQGDALFTKNNSIYLFGEFDVYDKEGKNITKEFTPKIKQLFLLLLNKSFNGSHEGINTEVLTAHLWPELSNDQAKNNRNVTISRLRSILENLDQVKIENEKQNWRLIISNGCYCDYVEFLKILELNNLDQYKIDQLNVLLQRGEYLQNISYHWLDAIKVKFIENSISRIIKLMRKEDYSNECLNGLADAILALDPVSEEGLSFKIRALNKLGRPAAAKKSYEKFQKEYLLLFDENYPKSYEAILND